VHSLRRLLVVALMVVVAAHAAIVAGLIYREGRIEAAEMFDAKLAHSARVLRALSDQALAESAAARAGEAIVIDVWKGELQGRGDDLVTEEGHAYETKLLFQVWDRPEHLLLRSETAPSERLAPLAPGFADVTAPSGRWRVFTLHSPSGLWYQAAEDDSIRDEIAAEIARDALMPLLVSLPLLALLVWGIVSWGCNQLARIAVELDARAPGRLDPLVWSRAPSELRPLLRAMNDLMRRLGDALAREKRLSSDAAHELRTPIAAVRVHAENARRASDPAERDRSIAAVEQGMLRLERLAAQLLELGRLEPEAPSTQSERIDLGACTALQLSALLEAGLGRGIDVELHGRDAAARVQGEPLAIEALLRNLIDNALRYTPVGGSVRIEIASTASGARLIIEDSGPGIADEAHGRVFDRFHRELGSGVSGSGLGLSIVKRAAESHGAQVALSRSAALGGLKVCVDFPSASSGSDVSPRA
jgi:two-component system sensor histidine kinase QseC